MNMPKPEMITGVRTYEIDDIDVERAEGGDGRMLSMQAVPYGVTIDVPSEGIREQFVHGAFAHQLPALHRVQGTYLHQSQGGEVIGRLHSGEDLPTGLRVSMRVSNTQRGNDTLELVRDKAITQVSIGFRAKQHPTWARVINGVTTRTKAQMFEVALVPQGAYGRNATVLGMRSLADVLRADTSVDPALDDGDGVEAEDALDTQVRAEGMSVDEARALVASIPLLPVRIYG